MWEKKKVIDAIKFLAVDFCCGSKIEHALKADGGLLTFIGAFADESWPHGIMEFGGFAHNYD